MKFLHCLVKYQVLKIAAAVLPHRQHHTRTDPRPCHQKRPVAGSEVRGNSCKLGICFPHLKRIADAADDCLVACGGVLGLVCEELPLDGGIKAEDVVQIGCSDASLLRLLGLVGFLMSEQFDRIFTELRKHLVSSFPNPLTRSRYSCRLFLPGGFRGLGRSCSRRFIREAREEGFCPNLDERSDGRFPGGFFHSRKRDSSANKPVSVASCDVLRDLFVPFCQLHELRTAVVLGRGNR